MSEAEIYQNQEKFILKSLRFDASKKYFGGISSSELSAVYAQLNRKNYLNKSNGTGNPDKNWLLLNIKRFSDADIAQALKEQMDLNPLRWKEIADLYDSHSGVENMLHMKEWYKENSGGELYKHLHEAYTKSILKLYGDVEINANKYASTYKNYWALRSLFNAFKQVCDINVEDFKKAKYRDQIIFAMRKKFPNQLPIIKPEKPRVIRSYQLELFAVNSR